MIDYNFYSLYYLILTIRLNTMLNLTRRYSHSVLFGGLQNFSKSSAVRMGTGAQGGPQVPYNAPTMLQWSSGRGFSRFYKKNTKRAAGASFRTHTLAEI
jgi:hypothetical protein